MSATTATITTGKALFDSTILKRATKGRVHYIGDLRGSSADPDRANRIQSLCLGG